MPVSGETKTTVSCDHCGKDFQKYIKKITKTNFCSNDCFRKRMTYNGIAWKGGKRKASNGYMEIHMPLHHRARGNGYVYEHILVMEKKLGRDIRREDGHIHHKDGNKTNNNPSNLQLLSEKAHHRLHTMDRGRKTTSKENTQKTKKPTKKERIVPKEKLPRGYYFLRLS